MIASLFFALRLAAEINRVASGTGVVVGVAAYDFTSRHSVSILADETFKTASVYKLPLAIEVLQEVHATRLRLDQTYVVNPSDFRPYHSPVRDRANGHAVTLTLRELIKTAVSESDNTTAEYLFRFMRPSELTRRLNALDYGPWFVAADETRDTATPNAALRLLMAIHEYREFHDRVLHEYLVGIMTNSQNPVRIGKLLPAGCRIAHKTGSMPGVVNDIGIVTSPDGKHEIAIAIFTRSTSTTSQDVQERLVANIAKTIYDDWVR